MKISELLNDKIVKLHLISNTKNDVIDELVDLLYKDDRISCEVGFKEAILKREEHMTTGIGFGIAIPHAKTEYVKKPSLAFGLSKEGIDYESLDGTLSHLFFMIAAPEGEADLHLKTLQKLSRKLMDEDFRASLLTVEDNDELLKILESID